MGVIMTREVLRQSFVFLDMPVLQQLGAYSSNAGKLFDESGKLTSDETA